MSVSTARRVPRLVATTGLLLATLFGGSTYLAAPALACGTTDVRCHAAQATTGFDCSAPGNDCSGVFVACDFPAAFTCTDDPHKAQKHGLCLTRSYDDGRPPIYLCPGPDVL